MSTDDEIFRSVMAAATRRRNRRLIGTIGIVAVSAIGISLVLADRSSHVQVATIDRLATTSSAVASGASDPDAQVLSLTETDRGRAFEVAIGDMITVVLTPQSPAPSTTGFALPEASGNALERVAGSEDPTTGQSTATFRAVAMGSSELTSGATCPGSQGCTAALAWYASVSVTTGE